MNLYDATVPLFTKMLHHVDKWLDKTVAFAEQKKFDPETLLTARLAPDQFALTRQIQSVCDHAKLTCARLAGKEAPSHPDTEKSIAELRERLHKVIAYLETFKREDFVGAEDREIILPRREKPIRGGDLLDHYALPNFYFHASMTYAILRHNGVDLGKADFISNLPFKS